MTQIDFLHFTDLHIGMGGLEYDWPTIRSALLADLDEVHELMGRKGWDLVLFTGDLAHSGTERQFNDVRDVLVELWEKFRDLGCEPRLSAVPGNHDLARPAEGAPWMERVTKEWWKSPSLQREVWDNKHKYLTLLRSRFKAYDNWWKEPGVPRIAPEHEGLLPGDFSATFNKDGVTLGLLGLNTTFLQLRDRMRPGSLALDVRQIRSACKPDLPKWASTHDTYLLLTHQPPSWLAGRAQLELKNHIMQQTQTRPALHLCGHMHQPDQSSTVRMGGFRENILQGAALFGAENWGKRNERRIHGYSAGQLNFHEDVVEIRIWPRAVGAEGPAGYQFRADQESWGKLRGSGPNPSGSTCQVSGASRAMTFCHRPPIRRERHGGSTGRRHHH